MQEGIFYCIFQPHAVIKQTELLLLQRVNECLCERRERGALPPQQALILRKHTYWGEWKIFIPSLFLIKPKLVGRTPSPGETRGRGFK